ncbi:hypothetical protein C789_2465 [Microcystis aeruginosa FACHB-905 = DIANCHI905]|uniref:Uncharacterized protein n=1 Tax=Microcystis aeruginosa PCC 7806SL TaxID=1903187 RepID=A0AB33C3B4_MICA7|nr:hypothetical protein BH695_4581 [Microcystis aeruginosa PCC 7806SL]ELS47722.1 hypothetical protein C789_2465 [Microcystis aeruginosa FACHB-905 = DIANCHI905]
MSAGIYFKFSQNLQKKKQAKFCRQLLSLVKKNSKSGKE